MEQLNGNEPFTLHGSDTSIILQDFWRWAYSDLLNNTHRGVLAEFLVHSALGTKDVARADWLPFDLTSPSGLRIEVKSSAYLQAWTPEYVFSQIIFDISKKLAWDGATYASKAMRNNDLYVFCVFTARTRDVSILDLDYWDFYVLPTSVLNEKVPEQKKISLSSLLKLEPIKTDFSGLPETNCQGLFNQIHRKLTKGARSTVWLLTPHLTDYIFPFSRSLQRYA